MDGNPAEIKYVPARDQFGPIVPTMAVIHDEEYPETLDSAERVAEYFQNPSRTGSAHYTIDVNSIVQCVPDHVKAAHAIGVNSVAIGLEHAGYARQTSAEWHDPYSWAMLQRSAAFLAFKCKQLGIPAVLLTVADLKAGKRKGITTHANVSAALPGSGHTDPGPGFPLDEYIAMVADGVHAVALPSASTALKLGSKGEAVAFFGDMGNIMAAAGFALNKDGKPSRVQIEIPKSKVNRAKCTFNGALHARAEEIQRFANAMAKMAGEPQVPITGVVDARTAGIVAYWVPKALAKLEKG